MLAEAAVVSFSWVCLLLVNHSAVVLSISGGFAPVPTAAHCTELHTSVIAQTLMGMHSAVHRLCSHKQ
jgi:hypothetical protein